MLKTNKAISKRIRVTKKGKLMHRVSGQGHNQSKMSGKIKRFKKQPADISDRDKKSIIKYLPYK